MIDRYQIEDIAKIWTEQEKFKYYLEVEIAHLKTLQTVGLLDEATVLKISKAKIDTKRIAEIEATTHHDVIAFCSSITEQFTPEETRYFHFGLTSSDVIDSAHALLIKDSMAIIEKDFLSLKAALRKKAIENADLLCLGRSHGISAEAMIFGQKFLSFESELTRRLSDWKEAKENLTGKFSGAVGNYTIVSPEQEKETLKRLGLKLEPVSSQVIPRDHYAKIITMGALTASLFERMATEFRLLQHSDIDEVREGFSKGQKGSSTMPHKKNPISSENLTGLARLVRSHVTPALENCVLWHERDISHSSVERMILPDHFGLLSYMARRMKTIVENLVVNRELIEKKVLCNEKIYSSLVLHKLIALNPSIKRETLYEMVQNIFFESLHHEDLIQKLEISFNQNQLKHTVRDWIHAENLRTLYKEQFKKILERN